MLKVMHHTPWKLGNKAYLDENSIRMIEFLESPRITYAPPFYYLYGKKKKKNSYKPGQFSLLKNIQ